MDEKLWGLVLTIICFMSLQKEFSLSFAMFSMKLYRVHPESQTEDK